MARWMGRASRISEEADRCRARWAHIEGEWGREWVKEGGVSAATGEAFCVRAWQLTARGRDWTVLVPFPLQNSADQFEIMC